MSARATPTGFDLGASQFAGATISQYYVFVGWLALRRSAILAERAHLLILGYATAVMVLVYVLLPSVLGVI